MKKLGQHFLANKQALEKIAGFLDLKSGETVIEIGPGHGELTGEIIKQLKNSAVENYKIIAVEKDGKLAEALHGKFSYDKNLEIISGDALKVLPEIVAQLPNFPIAGYKLVGNIPYYITGKLLRTMGELPKKPAKTVLTIQKEVAERICFRPPRMNRLAASVQFWAIPGIALILPKKDFRPAPEVDSATIILSPAPARKISEEEYYGITRAVFSQPRKTILNNLSGALEIPKRETEKLLAEAGIGANLRPQDLSVEDISKLASLFAKTQIA